MSFENTNGASASSMLSEKRNIEALKKSLVSSAHLRPENLRKKLLRLLEREQDWKPYRFDFKDNKVSLNTIFVLPVALSLKNWKYIFKISLSF